MGPMSSPRRKNLVYSVLIGTGLALIIAAFFVGRSGEDTSLGTDPAVERIIPAAGQLVLRQNQVGVDLAPDYVGVLQIDGVEIPADQLIFDDGQKLLLYVPGDGKAIEEFAPGQHCATAVFWRLVESRDQARTERWCFAVA